MRRLCNPELAAVPSLANDPDAPQTAAAVDAWLGNTDAATLAKRKRARACTSYDRAKKRALDILDAEKRTGAIVALRPGTLVGLYALLHQQVYGVEPVELRAGETWLPATAGAHRRIADLGNQHAVDFVRWVFAAQVARRSRGVASDFRVTWRWLFCSAAVLTDYRVHLAKHAKIRG